MPSAQAHETVLLIEKVDRDLLKDIAKEELRTMKMTFKKIVQEAHNKKFKGKK